MAVDMDEFAMAKLAREMAMGIRNYKKIFEDFSITEEDYYEISKHEFFKRAKEHFALEWNSALSTNQRIKLMSAAAAEEGLLTLGRRILNENEPLPAVVEAHKLLTRNAGMGEGADTGNSSDRFVITINLGADTEHYDKSIAIDANDTPPAKKLTK